MSNSDHGSDSYASDPSSRDSGNSSSDAERVLSPFDSPPNRQPEEPRSHFSDWTGTEDSRSEAGDSEPGGAARGRSNSEPTNTRASDEAGGTNVNGQRSKSTG